MEILKSLREKLSENSSEELRISGQRYFKEPVKMYGMKTATVFKIGKEYNSLLKELPKKEVFSLCTGLWQSGYTEESYIACEWAYSQRKKYDPSDFEIFEDWVKNYITNWASCDTLCNHTIGTFVVMFPEFISDLKKWAHSDNLWMRRASAVSLIVPAKEGRFLNDIFEIAGILLTDREDLVQKGYGWMLKSACRMHEDEVFSFVIRNRKAMPRTALRYAIEKMPDHRKKQAMAK